jgi:hypothetical protein
MAKKHYQRLTWGRRRQTGFIVPSYARASLWLGEDHLLCIDSNGYAESYKRFYFQDIQAVTIRATKRRLIWNWVLAVPAVIFVAAFITGLATMTDRNLAASSPFLALALLFAIPLLINTLLGPTCACELRTAVQIEQLPSLCRLRKTRRILARLRPLIAQAQGQLAPEEIPTRVQAWEAAAAAAAAAPATTVRYEVDDPNLPPRILS